MKYTLELSDETCGEILEHLERAAEDLARYVGEGDHSPAMLAFLRRAAEDVVSAYNEFEEQYVAAAERTP